MKPREIKIARRVAVDYMLIGIALGGSVDVLKKFISPEEMLTDSGKILMETAVNKDSDGIKTFLHARMGISVTDSESACECLIRYAKESNVEQYGYAVGQVMAEQLETFDDVDDMVQVLERATLALKASRER